MATQLQLKQRGAVTEFYTKDELQKSTNLAETKQLKVVGAECDVESKD